MSTGGATNRGQLTFNDDVQTRLDAVQQSGIAIKDPVQKWLVTTPVAKTGGLVSFQLYQLQGIDRIEVLRSIYRDSASANILASYPASQVAIGQPMGFQDAASFATGTTLYYWLRAMPIQSKFNPIIHGPFVVTAS